MRYLSLIFFITLIILNVACVSQKKTTNMPFKVSDAFYFSWVINENERGTTIEIVMDDVAEEVQFDSIIFRKVMLPVRIEENNEKQKVITATLPSGDSRIPVSTSHIDKPNQLIFHLKNNRGVQLLDKIKRKNMVYYK